MRTIASVQLDKRRPALILTRQSKLHLLTWVTVAPITSTIRGITSEVPVGRRNGLDHDSVVVSCDNITTVRTSAVGDPIGLLFDDQESALARAIGDAFELNLLRE
jgi:mRNA interferase MazF